MYSKDLRRRNRAVKQDQTSECRQYNLSDDLFTVFPEMDHCDAPTDMDAMLATMKKVLPEPQIETISAPQYKIGRSTRKGAGKVKLPVEDDNSKWQRMPPGRSTFICDAGRSTESLSRVMLEMENDNWEEDEDQPVSTTLQTYRYVVHIFEDAPLRLKVMIADIMRAKHAQKIVGDTPRVNAMEGFAVIVPAPM